jgi:hypothetical protein
MSKLKDHGSGDARLALSLQIGRYRLTRTVPGSVWITDTNTGEGGPMDEKKLVAKLQEFFDEEYLPPV